MAYSGMDTSGANIGYRGGWGNRKTTLWCHLIAALSNGITCILDPPGYNREPMKIMFLTTEDSVRKKLRKKLRLAGANMKNIITPDFVGDSSGMLHKLKFGSEELERVLRHFRPPHYVSLTRYRALPRLMSTWGAGTKCGIALPSLSPSGRTSTQRR